MMKPGIVFQHFSFVCMQDAKTGKMRDTGVRFADIAGLDHIIFEMREVVKMLLGDALYKRVRGLSVTICREALGIGHSKFG
jgi:ATP-dependent Zn protease